MLPYSKKKIDYIKVTKSRINQAVATTDPAILANLERINLASLKYRNEQQQVKETPKREHNKKQEIYKGIRVMTAYKFASSDEDADFSASLAIGFDCNKPYSAIK